MESKHIPHNSDQIKNPIIRWIVAIFAYLTIGSIIIGFLYDLIIKYPRIRILGIALFSFVLTIISVYGMQKAKIPDKITKIFWSVAKR